MATNLAPRPTGGNKNRDPVLLPIVWSEGAVALIVILLRLYARLMIKEARDQRLDHGFRHGTSLKIVFESVIYR